MNVLLETIINQRSYLILVLILHNVGTISFKK